MSATDGSVLELVDALNAARAEVGAKEAEIAAKDAEIKRLAPFEGDAGVLRDEVGVLKSLNDKIRAKAAEYADEATQAKADALLAASEASQARDSVYDARVRSETLAEKVTELSARIEELEGQLRTAETELAYTKPLALAAEALRSAFDSTTAPAVEA